jgi:TPR repeat protein
MTSQKIAIGLVAVALFVGSMTAHAADFSAGYKAYQRGDYVTALQIFRQLADQGNARAQFSLGVMYNKGQGMTQDYAEAMRWYRKAADQDYVLALYNLGLMYSKGQGVPQDYAEAARWYRKAAEQGYSAGQTRLGDMYVLGQGVAQDYVQAHMWFNLAAARGQKLAKVNRNRLAKQMTPEQIAEARRLAREWKPKGK